MSFLIIFHRINCFGPMPRHDMGMDPAASSVSFCFSLLLLKLIHHMVLGMTCHYLGYPFHHLSNKGIVQGIYTVAFDTPTHKQSWCPVGWREGGGEGKRGREEDAKCYFFHSHFVHST